MDSRDFGKNSSWEISTEELEAMALGCVYLLTGVAGETKRI